MDTYEGFKNIAGGIESIVLGAAAVFGGIWAAVKFGFARTQERGTLNLSLSGQALTDPHDNRLYLLMRLSVKNAGIRDEPVFWTKSAVRVARVNTSHRKELAGEEVKPLVEHRGDIIPLLDLTHVKIAVPAMDDPIYTMPLARDGSPLRESDLEPGWEGEYPFLVPVQSPGVYHVHVALTGSLRETKKAWRVLGRKATGRISGKAGEKRNAPQPEKLETLSWTASGYFLVEAAQAQHRHRTHDIESMGGGR